MRALALRLEAPLMAFGGVTVDENGVVTRFPGRSLLTGLLANALGWDQSRAAAHQALQERLRFAARLDREGRELVDFQTVDLGQPSLSQGGWTSRGRPEGRRGGTAATGTHIRRRHYHADARVIVVLTLTPPEIAPTLDDLAAALDQPARTLFLGRKACLPAAYLNAGFVEAASLVEALGLVLPPARPDALWPDGQPALWPAEEPFQPAGSRLVMVCDDRDWSNQIHVGRRALREGRIRLGGTP